VAAPPSQQAVQQVAREVAATPSRQTVQQVAMDRAPTPTMVSVEPVGVRDRVTEMSPGRTAHQHDPWPQPASTAPPPARSSGARPGRSNSRPSANCASASPRAAPATYFEAGTSLVGHCSEQTRSWQCQPPDEQGWPVFPLEQSRVNPYYSGDPTCRRSISQEVAHRRYYRNCETPRTLPHHGQVCAD